MTSLVVIYDSDRELAAIVDTDGRCGWGPAMIGPNAGEILNGWIESMPFDVGMLPPDVARLVFQEWIDGLVAAATETAAPSPDSPLEPPVDQGVAWTAEDEPGPAYESAEPPGPQPADTDMEADASPPPQVVDCPLCGATGVTSDGEDGATKVCPMCEGRKVVRMAVPS